MIDFRPISEEYFSDESRILKKSGIESSDHCFATKIVVMSIAAPINENMVDVIVEKAYHDVNGAYAIINTEFAKHCFVDFRYINREDDMGKENLRKAKMSYFLREIRTKFLAQSI